MPIRSHNASTHNVLLKVTVPKRTGRKRKKGSDGPFEGEVDMIDADSRDKVYSESRRDDPPVLRRKLQDNVGMYDVEPVGIITHTHRYRGMIVLSGPYLLLLITDTGLADFYWGEESSGFATRFAEQVAPRNRTQSSHITFRFLTISS
jgi:general transcription factor 3C polypeptide 5 (transcription factor C subunit 1)